MLLILFWMVAAWPVSVQGEVENGGLESMVRMVYPELGRIEGRLEMIERDMAKLPVMRDQTWGLRFGFHSGIILGEGEPTWVQIDLGADHLVDSIALVPVDLSYLGHAGEGYGFPKRFRIEVANNPEMKDAVTVVDCSQADVPNPGKYPRTWKFTPTSARHIRLTCLKNQRDENGYFWAMEEMMVLSEGVNVGVLGIKSASQWLDLGPQWALVRLADGQSALGLPVDVTIPSPSIGYLSAQTSRKEDHKWVTVDLLQPHVIDHVGLIPIESDEYEVAGGRGFPSIFVIELSNDPEFHDVLWREQRGSYPLGYPAGCALTVKIPDVDARYVRLTAMDMWFSGDNLQFGLAELQVVSGNHNVALGKPVTALDRTAKPNRSAWAPENLVDGYSSKFSLIGWPEYLDAIENRRLLVAEQADLLDRHARTLTVGRRLLFSSAIFVLIALAGACVWALVRGRIIRRREMTLLREQIARDLHDDIGSNLGGIMLLSEVGANQSGDMESREDFGMIRAAAHEASMSMRDIVWLIESGNTSLRELLTKMRDSAQRILGGENVILAIESEINVERHLSLLFRRHVLLAFKETLHNIQKHAKADDVHISVRSDAKTLVFIARDNGKGIDPVLDRQPGNGLSNLKRRAARLGGIVHIESHPGKGTTVTFKAPLDA